MMVNSQEKTNAVNRETIDWDSICWSKHKRIVNRLQARIVKAEDRRSRVPISHTGRLKYASRVIGNFHARFLEGGSCGNTLPYSGFVTDPSASDPAVQLESDC